MRLLNLSFQTKRHNFVNSLSVYISLFALMAGLFITFPLNTDLTNRSQAASPSKKIQRQNGMNFLATVSLELDGVELLPFLERYSQLYEFPFLIDRRVDPTTLLSGSFTDEAFIVALAQMLTDAKLSCCVVDNVLLYIGPEKAAGEALLLFNLKQDCLSEQFPKQLADKLNSRIDFEIPQYAEASEIFAAIAKRSRLRFSGFEKTPFDRWRGAKFNDVVVSDLLTIMGLGFGVDYRYDSSSSSIKPTAIDREQKVKRYYDRIFGLQIDQKKYPQCSFNETTLDGKKVICVAGFFKDVALVEYDYSTIRRQSWSEQARLAQNPPTPPKNSTNAANRKSKQSSTSSHIEISGAVSNKTLRDLFDYLNKSSQISCTLDVSLVEAGITLDSRITCEFKKSDVKEIASIIANKIGATAEVSGSKIVFVAK